MNMQWWYCLKEGWVRNMNTHSSRINLRSDRHLFSLISRLMFVQFMKCTWNQPVHINWVHFIGPTPRGAEGGLSQMARSSGQQNHLWKLFLSYFLLRYLNFACQVRKLSNLGKFLPFGRSIELLRLGSLLTGRIFPTLYQEKISLLG
jgi:hypothetical protein